MSEQINAYCSICGNGYHMCLSCKDKMKLSPWKVYTDSAEHYKIHQIIHGFSTKVYSEDEVRDKLKNVDLSDLETFKPHIKAIIKNVLKKEEVVEEAKAEEKVIFNAEENVVVEKPVNSRKRSYKLNNESEEVE